MIITHLVIIAVSLHLISIVMFQLLHSKVTTKVYKTAATGMDIL